MAKEVKLIDVVKVLKMRGHQVQYRVRNDGSIRITKLDGVSYRGSSGNIQARALAGVTLSEARARQLETIRTPEGEFGHKRKRKLTQEQIRKIRRVQRVWKKNRVKREGYVGQRGFRYNLEQYGEEEALRKLNEQERYARGLAYSENVEWIISYINDVIIPKAEPRDVPRLQEFRDIIARNKMNIKEADIGPIHQLLYDYASTGTKDVITILNELKKLYQ